MMLVGAAPNNLNYADPRSACGAPRQRALRGSTMVCLSHKISAHRGFVKALVLGFMQSSALCQPGAEAMKLARISRDCSLDWGDYPKATSSNQQYWVVALVRELEAEGKVERVSESGPRRLR